MAYPHQDAAALQRLIDNAEHNDIEAHKLYNNLGLAHAANRNYRQSLKAHREEKKICKRLLSSDRQNPSRHLDLAIAYRRCGDAMLKLDRLIDANNNSIDKRDDIIRAAHAQHLRGLATAKGAPLSYEAKPAIQLEQQAASAAVAQSTLALALFTQERAHFINAAKEAAKAARLAHKLVVGLVGLSHDGKQALLLGIALNHAIALSGLGRKKRARDLLHAVAMRARELDDHLNLVRALSNLSEDAGDEGEWGLCEAYVREWLRLARRADDHCDEADALRKLAVVLRETGRLRQAEEALQRSHRLHGSLEGKREAEAFLAVIRVEIEEHDVASEQMGKFQRDGDKFQKQGDFVEEAKCRLLEGNCAFVLHNNEMVISILGRYFELVDDFGCDVVITGVEESAHNSAVANMAESYWKLKNFEEAVQWATRELSVFDGDPPGQAQAWCNLGVYLDDLGKKEKAMDALRQSIAIAERCGETDTKKRAEGNLHLMEQEYLAAQAEKEAEASSKQDDPVQSRRDSTDREHPSHRMDPSASMVPGRRRVAGPTVESAPKRQRSEAVIDVDGDEVMADDGSGEQSIIIMSSQPTKKVKTPENGKASHGETESVVDAKRLGQRTCSSTKQSMRGGRQSFGDGAASARSRDWMGEDCTSRGMKNVADIVSEYKAVCERRTSKGARVRPMVVSAFRDLLSGLLSREACDQHAVDAVRLNLSALLLDNEDVTCVLETMATVGGEYDVFLDLSLNPLVSGSAYDCLHVRKLGTRLRLHSVKQLDLSCAGVTPEMMRKLADAFSEQGTLGRVLSLNISKNSLGRFGPPAVVGIARILCFAEKLLSLDLSLNLLSNSFLRELTDRLDTSTMKEALSTRCVLQSLNLSLNNRRAPTGLLETTFVSDIVRRFTTLFKVIPSLDYVNVRACGANAEMRRALRELGDSFTDTPRSIVTVSDANLEEEYVL